MVKVKEDEAMAEPKPAATPQPSQNNSSNSNATHTRKPRTNHQHTPHLHQTFHHYTYYHHHCTYPSDVADTTRTNGATSPARFYFGPGFEPQSQIPGGSFVGAPGPSQPQNNSEYVVFFHVNPGVTISFQMGDNLEILRGPVTVPMVSTNSSPPIAMPVQVPPGHMVQQIVDESGTLRHVILSPQHNLVPLPSHNPQHYSGGPNGTNQPQQQYYQSLTGFPPPHFHSNVPPGHPVSSPTHMGPSPPPPPTYYKDERAQRQHIKLKKKLQDKQSKGGDSISPRKELINGLKRSGTKEKGMNSVGTSEDGEESSVQDEEDSVQLITDILSSVQAPRVSELSSRSALLQWAPPTRLSEASSSDSHELDISEADLRYEVLLSDKSKEMKFKSIYSGASLSCRIQDLRPGTEYSVCLQVHLDELQGSATDPIIKFTTPPCEPDQPMSPKLINRTKNSLQVRWNAVNDNGSHILHYILEYDDGKGGEFVEIYKSRGKQHTLQKLQPATSYKLRLAAVNEVGKSAYSDIVTYSTFDNPPQQPNPPALVEATVSTIHLRWDRRLRDEEFILQLDDPNTQYGFKHVYHGTDNQYQCNKLTYCTKYRFRLRAQNDSGMSPWSEEVQYCTLPDRPARPSKPIVKGRIHAHSFKLKWEPPAHTGGADITKYVLEVNSGSGYRTVYSGCETEAVCDKLTPGTTYQLRVSCYSAGGASNYSDPCTVTTDAISPGQCPPPRLHGKPKSSSITIRWTEPDYNGGAPVLEYEVEMISPDSSRSLVHKSKETECTTTNLSPGCEYIFTVRAVNRIGPGSWSEPLKVTSGAAPPDAPEIPTLTCKTPFHVSVEWREPQSNGAPITDYRLEMNAIDTEETFQALYQGTETSYDVKGLTAFTTYFFRVQACNSAGWGLFSPVATAMTPAAPPSAITSLRHEATPTSITLYWTEPCCNGSEITRYNIEIGDKTITTEEPVVEYTIEDLQPDTHYKIKIQAVNEVGIGPYSSTLKTSTLRPPPLPPKLECVAVGHNYLKLKWGEGKNADYTQYCVEMENVRSKEFQCVYRGTAFTCKVNKLQELTTYKFRINACNDAGEGEFSDIYEFATGISPPATLKPPRVVELEQRSCTIEWLPGRNTFTDPLIYQVQLCRLKEQDFKQVYKGPETKHVLENLEVGMEYSARVCPIRLTSTGELPGPYSPALNFATPSPKPTVIPRSSVSGSSSPSHSHKSRTLVHSIRHILSAKSMSQSLRSFLYAVLITFTGIILAFICKWVYDNGL